MSCNIHALYKNPIDPSCRKNAEPGQVQQQWAEPKAQLRPAYPRLSKDRQRAVLQVAARILHQLENYGVVRIGVLKRTLHAYRFPVLWDEAIEILMQRHRVLFTSVIVTRSNGLPYTVRCISVNTATKNWGKNKIPDVYTRRKKKKTKRGPRTAWFEKHLPQMLAGQRHSFHLDLTGAAAIGAVDYADIVGVEDVVGADSDTAGDDLWPWRIGK